MMSTDINLLLSELKEKALSYYKDNLTSLVIFGSVAKDTWTPASDIDVLIVLKRKEKSSYEVYMDFYDNVERKLVSLNELNMRLSPIFLEERSLKESLSWLWDPKFIILYDRDDFFKRFIKRLERSKAKLKFIKTPMPHYVLEDG